MARVLLRLLGGEEGEGHRHREHAREPAQSRRRDLAVHGRQRIEHEDDARHVIVAEVLERIRRHHEERTTIRADAIADRANPVGARERVADTPRALGQVARPERPHLHIVEEDLASKIGAMAADASDLHEVRAERRVAGGGERQLLGWDGILTPLVLDTVQDQRDEQHDDDRDERTEDDRGPLQEFRHRNRGWGEQDLEVNNLNIGAATSTGGAFKQLFRARCASRRPPT